MKLSKWQIKLDSEFAQAQTLLGGCCRQEGHLVIFQRASGHCQAGGHQDWLGFL